MRTFTVPMHGDAVTLTGYLHDQSKELVNADKRPGMLVFPGGGYRFCSDREAEPIALAYMAEGFNAFVLRYSVGDEGVFPAVLEEAEAALQMIIENADAWHVQAEKIAVSGFSAGGHLAACLGTMGKVRPAALVLGYPCILAEMGQLMDKTIPSADTYVDGNTPPTLIFATADDNVVPARNSLAFMQAMAAAERPYELHIFGSGAHGLSLAQPQTSNGAAHMVNARVAQWFQLSVQWLKQYLGDFVFS